jgi:hypothetical protein
MRRSLQVTRNGWFIVVSSPTPYAEAHNSGADFTRKLKITPKMRRWAWAKFKESGNSKFKGMALTKKQEFTQHIKIPQRQFVGDHPRLTKNLQVAVRNVLKNALSGR